jgi:hypothetical protein
MSEGLLTRQLNARKAYRDADDAVIDANAQIARAKEAVGDAEAELLEAVEHARRQAQKRREALAECERLGIVP